MTLRSTRTQAALVGAVALLVGGEVLHAAPSPDRALAFLTSTAAVGRAMVETGNLAARRGGAREVRAVGNTVAEDWTAWLGNLDQLAGNRVVVASTTLDLEHQETLDRLRTVSSEGFDAAYLKALASDLNLAERLFEEAARSGDAEIQAFATHALPQLRADRRSTESLVIASDDVLAARPSARPASSRGATGAANTTALRLPGGSKSNKVAHSVASPPH